MKHWSIILAGMLVMLLESALLQVGGLDEIALQTAVILAVYLGTRREFVEGGLALAVLMIPMEWLAAGPGGFYILGISGVYFVSHVARDSIQEEWGLPHVLLCALMTLLQLIIMALAMLLLMPDTQVLRAMALSIGLGVLGVTVVAWPVGLGLTRLEAVLDPGDTSGRLEMG